MQVGDGDEEDAVGDVVPDKNTDKYTGSCLCGAVTFETTELSDIWYCHCKQCQKLTGLYVSAAGTLRGDLNISGEVNWLPISEKSNSGHCPKCGCNMFWDMHSEDEISILTGCLDDTSGLEVKGHIFAEEKSAHYEITDGLLQYVGYPEKGTR